MIRPQLKFRMELIPGIILVCCGVLLGCPCATNGDNILFFLYGNSYSHKVAMWPLAEALASRGHNVTFFSPHPHKTPNLNITELVPPSVEKHSREVQEDLFDIQVRVDNTLTLLLHTIFDYGYDGCKVVYDAPEFQAWLKTNPSIDLVIVDNCLCVECGVGVAHKLGAKFIVFSTLAVVPYEYDLYGYLPESSVVPEMDVKAPPRPLGFWTRVSNALLSIRWHLKYRHYYSPKMDALIRDKLEIGDDMPFIADLAGNASLLFYTGDVITDYPRTQPPNYVNIGGVHCKESTQPLPEDQEKFIQSDESGGPTDGFVYISFGSQINPSKLPARITNMFFQTIESFPRLKFLWRWNAEFPKNAPKNLLFSKWFPQNDILAHRNIRAFMTQGGRPSTLEAVYHGVPMISFPIHGDQDYNANRLEELGGTIKLEIVTATVEELRKAILKAVYDLTMKARMNELKKLFRDRPNTPLDTAVWWTEYVLRTQDTRHLKPAGHNQPWFVRRQIDVWVFLTVVFLLGLIGFLIIFTILAKLVFSRKAEKAKNFRRKIK